MRPSLKLPHTGWTISFYKPPVLPTGTPKTGIKLLEEDGTKVDGYYSTSTN